MASRTPTGLNLDPTLENYFDSYYAAEQARLEEERKKRIEENKKYIACLLYTSPSPRDRG